MEPREIIGNIEKTASLPMGRADRFAGYAVIGLPFRSGHVLALRRFPASFLGPGYTSVWHRNPAGDWTFYPTVAPEQGCTRYFGSAIQRNVVEPIDLRWTGPAQFCVLIGDALRWEVTLNESPLSRLMNSVARLVPDTWWQTRMTLKIMGHAARIMLGTGRMNLAGRTPNGHEFIANPQRVWLIDSSRAVVNETDLGPVGALDQQTSLNEFLIPQRGVFAVVRAFLEPPNGTSDQRSEAAGPLSSGYVSAKGSRRNKFTFCCRPEGAPS
jgi:hypothetical protein